MDERCKEGFSGFTSSNPGVKREMEDLSLEDCNDEHVKEPSSKRLKSSLENGIFGEQIAPLPIKRTSVDKSEPTLHKPNEPKETSKGSSLKDSKVGDGIQQESVPERNAAVSKDEVGSSDDSENSGTAKETPSDDPKKKDGHVFGSVFTGEESGFLKTLDKSVNVFDREPNIVSKVDLYSLLKVQNTDGGDRPGNGGLLDGPNEPSDDKDIVPDYKVNKRDEEASENIGEQEMDTNYDVLLNFPAKLYVWSKLDSTWSERGIVKTLLIKDKSTGCSWIASSSIGSMRTIQNTYVLKGMDYKQLSEHHVSFIGSDSNKTLVRYLLRISYPGLAEKFSNEVNGILSAT